MPENTKAASSLAEMSCEERYKLLVDNSEEIAIYFLSPGGHVLSWNRAAEKFKGYKSEEVLGKHLSIFYTEEDVARKVVDFELDQAKKSGRFEGGGWRVRKDGTKFWAEVIIYALKDEDGVLTGFAKIARDATEARKAQDVIEQQRRDLMELSTPVIQLWQGILALPIIGTLDSARSQIVMERLLTTIAATGASVAILDISGVPTVDTMVAQHLMRTMEAARLMGAECIISGIRPEIAQTIVHLGIDLSALKTRASMSRALEDALQMVNAQVVSKNKGKTQ